MYFTTAYETRIFHNLNATSFLNVQWRTDGLTKATNVIQPNYCVTSISISKTDNELLIFSIR